MCACAVRPEDVEEPCASAVTPAAGLLVLAMGGVETGSGDDGVTTGGVPEARRCTPAMEDGAGVVEERVPADSLEALLSEVGAVRAVSATSSAAEVDGSTIALSSEGAAAATLGAVRRGELMSAWPVGTAGVSRREDLVASTTDPVTVVRSEAEASSLEPRDVEPRGRACTGVISRARSAAAFASASAAAAASATFRAAAMATGSANESRLRLRETSGISAGATGSSFATGAGASSGGTGTPFRVRGACGARTTGASVIDASFVGAESRALRSVRLASGDVFATSDFELLEITLD